MTATTFDSNLMSASGMALSGGNLTATATAAASVGAARACSGLTYFQVTLGSSIGTAQLVGLVNRSFAFGTTLLGADGANNSVGYKSSDGTVKINNATAATIQTSAANAVIDVAYNPSTQKIWFRTNNGNWNNDVIANQNPVGSVGGISTAAVRGALYPAWGAAATGNNATAVFTSGFTNTPPTGYITVDTLAFTTGLLQKEQAKTGTAPSGHRLSLWRGYPAARGSTAPPVPVAQNLAGGVVGTPYSETISAQGGTPGYTFAVTGGSLPTSLSLNTATGVISGTPTVASSYTFIITATDTRGAHGAQSFTIVIAASAGGVVSNYGSVN
jgi:hypothetical protein